MIQKTLELIKGKRPKMLWALLLIGIIAPIFMGSVAYAEGCRNVIAPGDGTAYAYARIKNIEQGNGATWVLQCEEPYDDTYLGIAFWKTDSSRTDGPDEIYVYNSEESTNNTYVFYGWQKGAIGSDINKSTYNGEPFYIEVTGDNPGQGERTYDRSTGATQFITEEITIRNVLYFEAQINPDDAPESVPSGQASPNETAPSCENDFESELSWILCPIIRGMGAASAELDEIITNLLTIPNEYFQNADGSPHPLDSAWVLLRNFAYIILVPIMLVMVIGTALGYEVMSAYTIKKALPRLVFAVIFIALSWPLMKLLMVITNGVGAGVAGIMAQPAGGFENLTLASLFAPNGAETGLAGGAIVLGGLAFAATVSIGVIVAQLVILGIGILIGFTLLALRQFLVIALALIAPIAILSWIFPGRDKIWKLWWESFSKLLLFFPLIMFVIVSGRLFAWIVNTAAVNGGGPLEAFIKIVAYVGPYFFIPKAFQFAGGAFGSLAGMANNSSKGLFDRSKQFRNKKMASNWQDSKKGARFNGSGRFSSAANRTLRYGTNINRAGLRPSRVASNMRGYLDDTALESALEDSEKLPGAKPFFASDSHMLAGVAGKGDYQKTFDEFSKQGFSPEQAKIATSQALRIRQQMGEKSFELAAAAKLPGTGTAFEKENIGEWHRLIGQVSGGNKSLQASLVAAGKSGFRSAQRYEVSEAGFGTHLEAIEKIGTGEWTTQQATDAIVDDAYKGGGAGAIVGSRNNKSAEMFTEAALRDVRKAYSGTDEGEQMRALAQVANIQDQMAGSKRVVSDVLAKELFGFTPPNQNSTLLEIVNDSRDDPAFQQARRELSSEQAKLAEAAGRTTPDEGTGVGEGLTPPGPPTR